MNSGFTIGQCLHCGSDTKSRSGKYCSYACSNDARRKPRRLCAACGVVPVKDSENKYCSVACSASTRQAAPPAPCKVCGKPTTSRRGKFCSQACRNVFYGNGPKICIVCHVNTCKHEAKICSPECRSISMKQKAAQRKRYTPEQLAAFEADRRRGDTVPAMAARYGLTPGQMQGVLEREGITHIKPKKEKPKPAPREPKKPAYRPKQYSRRRPRQSATKARPTGPQPIVIEHLRELYMHVGTLRDCYGIYVKRDTEPTQMTADLSKAWRTVEPDHPGFRLKQQPNVMTRRDLVGR